MRCTPSASKLRDPACGADVCVQRLVAELLTDPRTALQAVMDAYLKLATHAKQRQQAGDPWPVLVIHDARSLLEYWKDDEALLSSLLCFFVAISKQAQLAHVILESGDTVLLQELESGAPARACAGVPLSVYSNCLSARAGRLHQAPVPLLVRGGKPGARGGAHVLLRLHRALSDAPAWRNGGMGARVRSVRRQSAAAADVRRQGRCILQLGSWVRCARCFRALRCVPSTAADRDDVRAGCNVIVQGAMADLSNGLRPEIVWKGAAWSAADLRAVLRTIVSSPHAAVPVVDLAAMLGAGGAAKLASMNGRDLLVLRAFDPLARDIDAAAFGPGLDEDVYTLPSAAHVLAARIELDV